MMREELVFGPIFSRRLGSSLGINLLPTQGKLCNFDCIYCECGWNKDGKDDTSLPNAMDLERTLRQKLIDCKSAAVNIDSITFAGDGEPTLNPDFQEIIDITLALRDEFYPKAKVSVLTNATRVHDDRVFSALKKVDNAILKLDAATDKAMRLINKPLGNMTVAKIIENMRRFKGDFILQTMFLKSKYFDSSEPKLLRAWKDIVRDLRPREIMVYTLDRPAPSDNLQKYTVEQMREMVQDLIDEGFKIQIR